MKFIVVQWFKEDSIYKKQMRVMQSTHPRFVNGSRFDFGFMEIAIDEGFAITVLPSDEILDNGKTWKDGYLIKK